MCVCVRVRICYRDYCVMQFVNVAAAHSHGVKVCEILAVYKSEDDQDDHTDTRSQKAKQHFLQFPHAFTGN